MQLNDSGKIVVDEWLKSFEIRRELIRNEFVVMPNHIHGIVQLINPVISGFPVIPGFPVETHGRASPKLEQSGIGANETHSRASLRPENGNTTVRPENGNTTVRPENGNTTVRPENGDTTVRPENGDTTVRPENGVAFRARKSVSSFVAGFKSAATKRIKLLRNSPYTIIWQPRFHDHIIRDENEFFRIRQYIRSNPDNWEQDKFKNGNSNVIREDYAEYEKEIWMV